MARRAACPQCSALRPVLWLAEPYVGILICPWCDNVDVWWPGGLMSMSVSAWTLWVEGTFKAASRQPDDPPPPSVPRDKLDKQIEKWIKEAERGV